MSVSNWNVLSYEQQLYQINRPILSYVEDEKPGDWLLCSFDAQSNETSDWTRWNNHLVPSGLLFSKGFLNDEGILYQDIQGNGVDVFDHHQLLLGLMRNDQLNQSYFWIDEFQYCIESLVPSVGDWSIYSGKKLRVLNKNSKPYESSTMRIEYQTDEENEQAHQIRILFTQLPTEDLIIEFPYAKESNATANPNEKLQKRWIGKKNEPSVVFLGLKSIQLKAFFTIDMASNEENGWIITRHPSKLGYQIQNDLIQAEMDSRIIQWQQIELFHDYESYDVDAKKTIKKQIKSGPILLPAMHPSVLLFDEQSLSSNGWVIKESPFGVSWSSWWKKYIDPRQQSEFDFAAKGQTRIAINSIWTTDEIEKTTAQIENEMLVIQGLEEQEEWSLPSDQTIQIKENAIEVDGSLSFLKMADRFYVPYEAMYKGTITKQQPLQISYQVQKSLWKCDPPVVFAPTSSIISEIHGTKKLTYEDKKWKKTSKESGMHSMIATTDQKTYHHLFQWECILQSGSAPIGFCVDVRNGNDFYVVMAERQDFSFQNQKEVRYQFNENGIQKIHYDASGANGAITNKSTFLSSGFHNLKFRLYYAQKKASAVGGYQFKQLATSNAAIKGLFGNQLFRITVERLGKRIAVYLQQQPTTKPNDALGLLVLETNNVNEPTTSQIGTIGFDQSQFTIEKIITLNAQFQLVKSDVFQHETAVLKKHALLINAKDSFQYDLHFLPKWNEEQKDVYLTRSFGLPSISILTDNIASKLSWTTSFLPDAKQPKRVEVSIQKPTSLPIGPVSWHSNDYGMNLKGTIYFEYNGVSWNEPIFTPKIERKNLPSALPKDLKQIGFDELRVLDERFVFEMDEAGNTKIVDLNFDPIPVTDFEPILLIENEKLHAKEKIKRIKSNVIYDLMQNNQWPMDIPIEQIVMKIDMPNQQGVNFQFVNESNQQWFGNQMPLHTFRQQITPSKETLTGNDWCKRCVPIGHEQLKAKWKKSKTNGYALYDNQRMFTGFLDQKKYREFKATFTFTPFSTATYGRDDDPIGFIFHGEHENEFYMFMIEGREMIADSQAKNFPAFRMSDFWGENNDISFSNAKGADFDAYTILANQYRNTRNGIKSSLTQYYSKQLGWKNRHMKMFHVQNGVFKAYKPDQEWFTYFDGWKLNQKNNVTIKCYNDQVVIDLNGKRVYFAQTNKINGKIGFCSFSQLVELHQVSIENMEKPFRMPKVAIDAWTYRTTKKAMPLFAIQSLQENEEIGWQQKKGTADYWKVKLFPILREEKIQVLAHWNVNDVLDLPVDLSHESIEEAWDLIKSNGLYARYEINEHTEGIMKSPEIDQYEYEIIDDHHVQLIGTILDFYETKEKLPIIERKTKRGWVRLTIEHFLCLSGVAEIRETIKEDDELRIIGAKRPLLLYKGMQHQNQWIEFPNDPRHPHVFLHSEKNGFLEIPELSAWTDAIHQSPTIGLIQSVVTLYVTPYEIGTYENEMWHPLWTNEKPKVMHTTNEHYFDPTHAMHRPTYLKLATCRWHLPSHEIEISTIQNRGGGLKNHVTISDEISSHLWDYGDGIGKTVMEQGTYAIEIPSELLESKKEIIKETIEKHKASGVFVVPIEKNATTNWTRQEIEEALSDFEIEIAEVNEKGL